MKFEIPGFIFCRLEEHFEHIIVPRPTVVFSDVRKQIIVFHPGEEVEELSIPQQPGLGRCLGRMSVFLEPRQIEVVDDVCVLPAWFDGRSINDDRRANKPALKACAGFFCSGVRWQEPDNDRAGSNNE